MNTQNDKSFTFFTRLHLRILTGRKASNLTEFLRLLKKVPGTSIYYHTHHFLQQHRQLSPEPPNDFAYWVSNALNEEALGEKIASIDTIGFHTIRDLRDEIVKVIEEYIKENPRAKLRFASPSKVFHFIESKSFILATPHVARNLEEFAAILKEITVDSLYFHMFEARLRLDKETNDFSFWLGTSLMEEELAAGLKSLDPYTYTMEALRSKIVDLVEERIRNGKAK